MTTRTIDINIGQKLHIELDLPIPFTAFTAASDRIKTKTRRFVTPHFRKRALCKKVPKEIKQFYIGRRVGAGATPHGGLVHAYSGGQLCKTLNRFVSSGYSLGTVEAQSCCLCQDIIDQCAFARPGDTADNSHQTKGKSDIDIFQIIFRGATHRQPSPTCSARGSALLHPQLPANVGTRQGSTRSTTGLQGPLKDNVPALFPGSGTQLDEVVGTAHGLRVMFDNNHSIPSIAEIAEHGS